jgi:hypothetical protein
MASQRNLKPNSKPQPNRTVKHQNLFKTNESQMLDIALTGLEFDTAREQHSGSNQLSQSKLVKK